MMTTAREFLALLEDRERWLELDAGRLVRLSPPDDVHGNAVRNLGRALGRCLRKKPELFLCFELALHLKFDPDTVRCPAICAFRTADGVGELDRLMTERRPELIIEIASSNDRREAMSKRLRDYEEWGVPHIWVFDPVSLHAHVFSPTPPPRMLKGGETLRSSQFLPDFEIQVGKVFDDPQWIGGSPGPG